MSRPLARRGLGGAGLSALAERLSERDQTLLRELCQHRFLTTDHLRRLVFTDHASLVSAARSTRRVLARLEDWRLIERLARRVGGLTGGAATSTWLLSESGQRMIGFLDGHGTSTRVQRLGRRLVDHHLAVAETHLALREAHAAGKLELLEAATEPVCWRTYMDGSGARQVLKPDLAIVTATGDYEDHWWIEVDRGTEGLPTLLRQCQAYARYRATGQEQTRTGVFPRIIWLLPTARRRDQLLGAIGDARHLESGLFYALLTPDQLVDFVAGGAS